MRSMQWRTLKCFFQNSFRVEDVSSVPLKHLVKSVFVYSFLKLQITCFHGLRKSCRVGGKELDLYEVLRSIHTIHQGWRVAGHCPWEGTFRQLAGRYIS